MRILQKKYFIFLSLFLLVFIFINCERDDGDSHFSIYFTGDVNGRIIPCGCFTGQHGGLSRIHTALLQKEKGIDSVLVDVGDAIQGQKDYEFLLYEYVWDAFHYMGYDAVNMGKKESLLSLVELKAIKTISKGKAISCNLIDQQSGALIFDPYVIVEKDKKKIGILGVVDHKEIRDRLATGVAVNDMELAIRNQVKELAPQVDYIVLLAFTDQLTLQKIAKENKEVHVVLGGDVNQPSQSEEVYNQAVVAYTTNDSRALGYLRFKTEGKSLKLQTFSMKFVSENIYENYPIKNLMVKYRENIGKFSLNVDKGFSASEDMVPGVMAKVSYVGSEACGKCHQVAFDKWKKSGHSKAYESLKNVTAHEDPHCIKCHTVGFDKPGGYLREYKESKLINVGCENCHGPASEHVKQRMGGENITFSFRKVKEQDCKMCHFGEFSRPFEFDHFWPSIEH